MVTELADQVNQLSTYGEQIKLLQEKIADLEARPEWYQELMGPFSFDNKRQTYIRELDLLRETQRQAAASWIETCEFSSEITHAH